MFQKAFLVTFLTAVKVIVKTLGRLVFCVSDMPTRAVLAKHEKLKTESTVEPELRHRMKPHCLCFISAQSPDRRCRPIAKWLPNVPTVTKYVQVRSNCKLHSQLEQLSQKTFLCHLYSGWISGEFLGWYNVEKQEAKVYVSDASRICFKS